MLDTNRSEKTKEARRQTEVRKQALVFIGFFASSLRFRPGRGESSQKTRQGEES
jgi:hypothetical protein